MQSSREQLVHALYEAAELEHTLMCTYLYAAFSPRSGESEGLSAEEAVAVARWRREILHVAIEEMGHLAAVWNLTSALGGTPRFGRGNFPLDAGILPAGVVVRLEPFSERVLQHFIFLERPVGSREPDGEGFASDVQYRRAVVAARLTPIAVDYDTVGEFYAGLAATLRALVERSGDSSVFCGDPALQLSESEVRLLGAVPVRCLRSALDALQTIVEQGEGAQECSEGSHYRRFVGIRREFEELRAKNPAFSPAHPAAVNPILRPPPRAEGRVFLEDEAAAATVDVANTGYAMMLRLLAYSYVLSGPSAEKTLVVDLAMSLMRAVTLLAERAARMPAGPSNPGSNAGVSFTALRDASPFPPGIAARTFFVERLRELAESSRMLVSGDDPRATSAARHFEDIARRAAAGLDLVDGTEPVRGAVSAPAVSTPPVASPSDGREVTTVVDGVEYVEGRDMTLIFEGRRCIHARFCVTGGPDVFLANVEGPWIHPDSMDTELLVGIAHVCPSGAIRYRRKDGRPDEAPPPVNLLATRESGPYALRGDMRIEGCPPAMRATLCRCGASKRKPFCDGSHHEVGFDASGEPPTDPERTEMLPVRNGILEISPQLDGPLQVRGNLEITSGTGRMVSRLTSARLCRCGGSGTKPFCDGTHQTNGFRS